MKHVLVGIAITAALLAGCGSDSEPSGSSGSGGTGSVEAGVDAEAGIDAEPDIGIDATPDADAGDPRFAQLEQVIEQERTFLGAPGVAVAVIADGQLAFSKGFGTKLDGETDPVQDTTLFRIASMTKMLTATAVLQLVESGDIDLDASVVDYVPDFKLNQNPDPAPTIQIRHLLTHSSGLNDYLLIDYSNTADTALSDFLTGPTYRFNTFPMAPSGRFYNYSNPNFMLAGLVTERVAGKFYREVMRDEVFSPLGMDRTFFLGQSVVDDGDFAYGKTLHWTTGVPTNAGPMDYENVWGRPAGYAYSSVRDLAKFANFLMDGNDAVLGTSQREAMQSEQIDTQMFLDHVYYGYGLVVTDLLTVDHVYYAMRAISHDGALNGFSSYMFLLPSERFGFIVLANTDGAYFTDSLAAAIKAVVTLPAPIPPPDPGIDPTTFDMYVGDYTGARAFGNAIVITREADDLMIELPGLAGSEWTCAPILAPTSRHNFILTLHNQGSDYDIPATFILDEAGNVEYFRTRSAVGKRVVDTDAGAAPQAMAIDSPDALARQLQRDAWNRVDIPRIGSRKTLSAH